MTPMETGFLALVGAAFGAFCLVLAWAVAYTKKPGKPH